MLSNVSISLMRIKINANTVLNVYKYEISNKFRLIVYQKLQMILTAKITDIIGVRYLILMSPKKKGI